MKAHQLHRLRMPGILAPIVLLAACAQTPMGPTVQVMPGAGKSFEAFQYDQSVCRQFAQQAVTGQAENANMRGVGTAAVTTVIGAGLGAAIGGGQGAGIGAASGALGGAGLGAMTSSNEQRSIQVQYNNAYVQCMYSKGNAIPGHGPMMTQPPPGASPPPVPPGPAAAASNLVGATQEQLIRLGYMSGPADGVMGPMTSSAISQYETAAGLPVDGAPSNDLLARLRATTP